MERKNSARPMSTCSSSVSLVDRLLDITKCQICLDTLEEPRYLPCHHSFCTKCIQRLMNSGNGEFLCPVDRKIIKIPKYGISAFEIDSRTIQLDALRNEVEDNLYFIETEEECDRSVADIDVNLEWLTKGIQDIAHSSAMAQHTVHTTFDNVYKSLKRKEEEFVNEIQQKCTNQLDYMEYEKYRLIETKKYQNELFHNSICEDFQRSIVGQGSDVNENTTLSQQNDIEGNLLGCRALHLSIASCHIGHQHINFLPCETKMKELDKYLQDLGRISWEFDLKINLHRDLGKLAEYPCGIEVKGIVKEDVKSTLVAAPTGITKGWSNRLLVACSGTKELIILDNSFNIESTIIGGKEKFQSIGDIATYKDNIYLVDSLTCQIILLNKQGEVIKCYGKKGPGTLELYRPSGITVDSRGRVLVADSLNHRIKILSSNLQKCSMTIDGKGHKDDPVTRFNYPSGITVDRNDNIYVCDTNNKRVVLLTKDGKYIHDIKPAGLSDPKCVAVTSDDKILITDRENCKLMICDVKGKNLSHVSGITNSKGDIVKFKQIHGVMVDGTDKIMVTDMAYNSVFLF